MANRTVTRERACGDPDMTPIGTFPRGRRAIVHGTLLLVMMAVCPAHGAPSAIPLAPAPEQRVNSQAERDQQNPALACNQAGNCVVAWESVGQDGSLSGVYAQRYAADGSPAGGEFRVNPETTNHQFAPTVAVGADGGFAIAWASNAQSGPGIDLRARRYAPDGSALGTSFRINSSGRDVGPRMAIALDAAGDLLAVWTETIPAIVGSRKISSLVYQRFGPGGTPVGNQKALGHSLLKNIRRPALAVGDDPADGFVVVVHDDAPGGLIFGDIELGTGIYARRYTLDGRARDLLPLRVDPAGSDYVTDRPAITALPGGGFAVAWHRRDANSLRPAGVAARAYDGRGKPYADAFTVGDAGLQRDASVTALSDGSLLIAAQGAGIGARRYSTTGIPLGPPLRIDTRTLPDTELVPQVAALPGGEVLAVWQSFDRADDGARDIYARRLAP